VGERDLQAPAGSIEGIMLEISVERGGDLI
jgi:hypothetical protein